MPKDFNQSTSLESHLKLQWVDSNTSTITIRTLYVSNINTDCVQMYDSLFHTPPRANYNSVCSPLNIIHLSRQVKLIGKSGELHWRVWELLTNSPGRGRDFMSEIGPVQAAMKEVDKISKSNA